jgi:uncharacterized protein (TIGR03118 family)
MSFHSWLRDLRPALAPGRRQRRRPRRPATPRPRLEVLEDRTVPSGFQQINLVGYQPGAAPATDPNLNGWGMTSLPGGLFVVANPFSTGVATVYDSSGHVLPLQITVPASAAHPFGTTGEPTGVVYNPTSDFVISENGKSAPALLIFDTLDGTISGWNPAVDATHALVMADNGAAGARYTGLEIARDGRGQNLYAADIGENDVEMYGSDFSSLGSFTDATATSVYPGSGAWSVQAVGDKLYVTWADPFSPVSAAHGGVVDVFNTHGKFLKRLAANAPGAGPLENPWGVVQAPKDFGAYSNDLLIGNVAGDGNINAFDPGTGAYVGQLGQPNGAPIAIKGLWDLEFGDGTPLGGKTDQLFFDAGPNAPLVSGYGLFGVIQPASPQGGDHGSDALPVDVLSPGTRALPGGVQAQPATSPIPAPAAGAAGTSQAVPPVPAPAGAAPGLPAYWVSDQVFADLEGIQSLVLAPTADPQRAW